ncbi:phytanoyl-CoA dioxygenase family protein [Paenibacillus cymbidii]|uniref:phytanoyl-CoA dioxygenase family protein n=1 Tax=Paenibacillus cymbidii TaxID=1639034 RepID=UPI001436B5C1|nr:phytanoyl-CoA dioxygenase family protein [Paenibacillus cymbidii]
MAHVLTQEQIDFYRTNHYLLVKQVVPLEAIELATGIMEKWVDRLVDGWYEQGLLTDKMAQLDVTRRLVDTWQAAGKPRYIRSPRRDIVCRETFDFLRHPRLVDVAADLLGSDEISVHGTFNSRPKLPDQKWTDTPWHQDAQYYREAEHKHVMSMWIPLQRVTERNSCLQVAPGFFTDHLRDGHVDDESGFLGLSKEDAAQLKGVSIEMEAGDALVFNQLLPHRALSNQSDAVRWSMDMRFESTPDATESGKALGFVARSAADPASVTTYEAWLAKWAHMPAGSY